VCIVLLGASTSYPGFFGHLRHSPATAWGNWNVVVDCSLLGQFCYHQRATRGVGCQLLFFTFLFFCIFSVYTHLCSILFPVFVRVNVSNFDYAVVGHKLLSSAEMCFLVLCSSLLISDTYFVLYNSLKSSINIIDSFASRHAFLKSRRASLTNPICMTNSIRSGYIPQA
jgi:hypothetical protein